MNPHLEYLIVESSKICDHIIVRTNLVILLEKKYEHLMEVYPKATFILTTTILEHNENWDISIEEVCKTVNSPRVHHFLYSQNGKGTPGHIRIPEAEQMSKELTAFIESLGEKIWDV